jgi:ABC-type multidrug transport system fused ATPase/permease subunit
MNYYDRIQFAIFGIIFGLYLTKRVKITEHTLENKKWKISDALYYGAWIVMGLSHAVSGLHKLGSPSWINGDAMQLIFEGPLARQNIIVLTLLNFPFVLKLMTWGLLFAEISFMFLGTFYHLRKWYWMFSVFLHIIVLFTINFSDLTFGILMIHFFTFDVRWFNRLKKFIDEYCDQSMAHILDTYIEKSEVSHNHAQNSTSIPTFETSGADSSREFSENQSDVHETTESRMNWFGEIIALIKQYMIAGTILILLAILGSNTNILGTFDTLCNMTIDTYSACTFICCTLFGFMVFRKNYPRSKTSER